MQHSYSRDSQTCIYAPGHLGPVKLNFLVDTECTHNVLPKATFDHLLAAIKERLEPWDITSVLADSSGLPVYRKIVLAGRIRNSPFSLEFVVSQILDKGFSA